MRAMTRVIILYEESVYWFQEQTADVYSFLFLLGNWTDESKLFSWTVNQKSSRINLSSESLFVRCDKFSRNQAPFSIILPFTRISDGLCRGVNSFYIGLFSRYYSESKLHEHLRNVSEKIKLKSCFYRRGLGYW